MNESGASRPARGHADGQRPDEAAQDWLLLLSSGDATADDRARFERWVDSDPSNRAAYEEVRELWQGIDDLRDAFAPPEQGVSRRGRMQASGAVRRPTARRRGARWGPPQAAWGAVAAACLVLLAAVAPELALRLEADYRTAVGEQAQVTLPDGSIAWLNTDTALAVNYTSGRREVSLLRGEARFQVAQDPKRPFSVGAHGGRAQALGTVYSVRDHDREVTVTVAEGTVGVLSPAPPRETTAPDTGARAVVNAGEQVRYREGAPPGAVRRVDAAAVTAWRHGFIAIRGLPLAAALAEIDRYRPGEILLLADSATGEPVTARLSIRSIDNGLAALAATQGLSVTRVTDYLILVH